MHRFHHGDIHRVGYWKLAPDQHAPLAIAPVDVQSEPGCAHMAEACHHIKRLTQGGCAGHGEPQRTLGAQIKMPGQRQGPAGFTDGIGVVEHDQKVRQRCLCGGIALRVVAVMDVPLSRR